MNNTIFIVPEPVKLNYTGKTYNFDGFTNFSDFLAKEFNIPHGSWRLEKIEHEGTGLKIQEKVVKVWGEEKVYLATLIQLIRQGNSKLPEVEIEEKLFFKFRGFHLDIARGGVPRVNTFKRILRWLFLLKYNYFAIYFEDLFPWKKYPTIGVHRGRLTEKELGEIVEYGKKLGIQVIPSLELLGHMENILTLPEFRKYSEWHRPREGCLDLSNEEAKRFVYNLLEEVIDFFKDAYYIHIGGDETWALGRGKSLNKTWKFEGPRLYEEHYRKLIEIVSSRGKKPILWGDMITGIFLSEEERKVWSKLLESNIWNKALIANWNYSSRDKEYFKEVIQMIKKYGYPQLACTSFRTGRRYYPPFDEALKNAEGFLTAAREEKIEGFLVTAWGDDGSETLFSFLDPLILASMEIAEGNGKWEEKWLALTGESEDVLRARKLFGKTEVVHNIKDVLLVTLRYKRMTDREKEELVEKWRNILESIKSVKLPRDLEFIRQALMVGIKRLENRDDATDYIFLTDLYSELWLTERKPNGLENIIQKFWGAAGRKRYRTP